MDLDYSDGTEIESQIESLLTEAKDLSSLTSIAHARYAEWPVRYHLCPERANLLRHLNFSTSKVLELGAGMGAVSRFLAEKSQSLTVVEGTQQRFSALSERLRDLSNWSGLVSNIMDVSFPAPFDIVVVVGALEYSELYVKTTLPGESPFDAFLKKAKSFLKPDGVLILAIENQLGLKYFNGATEDHTSHPYDGISGYSKDKSPRTFSRKKLLRLFESAGFHSCHEYYPFPDYKMPSSVLTPVLCNTEPGLAASLATHGSEHSNGIQWNTFLGAQSIAEAGLLPELANSFLVVASEDLDSEILRKVLPPADELAWHYSTNRKAPICTKFLREQGLLRTRKIELSTAFESPLVQWTPKALEPIKRGTSVRESLLRSGYFQGSKAWFSVLSDYLVWALDHFKSSPGFLVPNAVDALYTNALHSSVPGFYEPFDLEWTYSREIPASWFVLRNLLALYQDTHSLALGNGEETLEALYRKLCGTLSIELSLDSDVELEAALQAEITPENSVHKFSEALSARVRTPLKCRLKRKSVGELSLFQERFTRLTDKFPDFLSAMDRPSTRFFLALDEKLRRSRFFRSLFESSLKVTKSLYRLLPATYKIQSIQKTPDGNDLTQITRTFGAFPKAGWALVNIEAIGLTGSPAALDLRLTVNGKYFTLSIPRMEGNRYHRIFRLHESVQEMIILTKSRDDLTIRSVTSRNLLKTEVTLRTVPPLLRKGFPWKQEKQRVLAFWKQGKRRGLIAYIHTLVLKGNIGVVESYGDWTRKYDTLSEKDRTLILAHIKTFEYKPKISILMPVYNTDPRWLEKAVASVEAQLYPNWELCMANDASTDPDTLSLLKACESRDPRIKVIHRAENGHISLASNSALEAATGEFTAILDHDDELSPHALYHVVRELTADRNTAFLYSDEDKLDTQNRRFLPHFKTDWNPELFYCYNLITHFTVIKTELVRSVGAFRGGFEGSQDYDLFLRCIEKLERGQIRHIPHVLYHWRVLDSSTSGHIAAKPYAKEAALKALNEHLERKEVNATVVEGYNDCFRVKYALPTDLPKVSIIICTRDRADLLRTVIEGIQKTTDYSNLEILIVNNQSAEKATLRYLSDLRQEPNVRILNYDQEFNFAAMNNLAAKSASGDILAFLNNDLKVTQGEWLKEMLSFALQPHVGAVGAKLLYPSGRLQHAGVILGIGGVAGHSHKGFGPHQGDFYARTHVSQCVSAVTAACLVVRKKLFEEVQGFDESHLTVAFNDVDFCLKLREKGYLNVWTPYAELIHFESESRGSDQLPETFPRFQKEEAFMKDKWGTILKQDPYYSPNLTLERENFDLAYPPRLDKPWNRATHGVFQTEERP